MDTPPRISGQYVCSSCPRVFTYRKCMEKHIVACMRKARICMENELEDNALKDAVHCTAVVKQELRTPIVEANWTGQAPETDTLTASSTAVASAVANTDNQMTLDNNSMKTSTSEVCTNQASGSINIENPINSLGDDIYDDDRDLLQISTRMEVDSNEKQLNGIRPQHPLRSTSKQDKYKCDQCGVSFAARAELRAHSHTHLGVKPYKCHKCVEAFECESELQEHLKWHMGKLRYECNLCEMSFAYSMALRRHKRVHDGIKSYNCAICERSFENPHLLKSHMKRHIGTKIRHKGLHKCRGCDQYFVSLRRLRRHKQKCKVFLDGRVYTGRRKAPRPFTCYLCTETFSSLRHFNGHGRLKHMDHDACRCTACGIKTFRNAASIASHIKGCKQKRDKLFYGCNHCGSAFKTTTELEDHLQTHALYNCNACGASITTFTDFNHHVEEHHHHSMEPWHPDVLMKEEKEEVPDSNPYVGVSMHSDSATAPEEQNMNLQLAYDLPSQEENMLLASNQSGSTDMALNEKSQADESWMHEPNVVIKEEAMGDELNYPDDSAELSKTAEASLQQHSLDPQLVNVNEAELMDTSKPDDFQHLQASTPSETKRKDRLGLLKRRRNRHITGRVHGCYICKKSFTSGSALKCHLQRHLGMLPHKCSMCELSFVSPSALQLHENRHLGIRPYKCSTCDHASVTRTELKKHMRSHIRRLQRKVRRPSQRKVRTPSQPLLTHKCTSCQAWFSSLEELQQHLESHEEENAVRLPVEKSQIPADGKYKCDLCDKTFASESTFVFHKNNHPPIHKCDVCDAVFFIKARFDEHMNSHLGLKPHKCHICRKAFAYSSYLKVHIRKHMGQLQHQCTMCERSFVTPFSLREHLNRHLGIKPHKCNICDLAYVTVYELKSHMKSHRHPVDDDGGEQFFEILEHDAEQDSSMVAEVVVPEEDVNVIEASAVQKERTSNQATNAADMNPSLLMRSAAETSVSSADFELENNLQLTSDVLEKADSLMFSSSQPADMTAENVSTQPAESQTNEGEICVKIEDSDDDVIITDTYDAPPLNKSDLERPEVVQLDSSNSSEHFPHPQASSSRTQEKSESFDCDECDAKFGNSDELIYHLKQHLANMVHECQFCKKTFTRSAALMRHIKIHTQNLRFKCTKCERSFPDTSSLRAHEHRHLGIKPYQCTSHGCQQAFVTRSELNRHMKIHLKVQHNGKTRPLPKSRIATVHCQICNKPFNYAKALQRHLQEHEEALPFKCTICDKSYKFASVLRVHQNRHLGVKPYKCNICGLSFVTPSDLNRHSKQHLGEDFGGRVGGNAISDIEDSPSEYSGAEMDPLDEASQQQFSSQDSSNGFSIVFMEEGVTGQGEIEQIDLDDDDTDAENDGN